MELITSVKKSKSFIIRKNMFLSTSRWFPQNQITLGLGYICRVSPLSMATRGVVYCWFITLFIWIWALYCEKRKQRGLKKKNWEKKVTLKIADHLQKLTSILNYFQIVFFYLHWIDQGVVEQKYLFHRSDRK